MKTLLLSMIVLGAGCGPAQDATLDVSLPHQLALSRLSQESQARLRATASIPGVLSGAELQINLNKGNARGTFTLPNRGVSDAVLTVEFFSALTESSTEVLIGRAVSQIDITKGDENIAKLAEVSTDGQPVFDLNRNERSNLVDLLDGFDPAPGPIPMDISPRTVSFNSGVEVGNFTRSFFVLENTSDDELEVDIDIRLAPGVSVVELSKLFDNGAASASTHLEKTLAGGSEDVFAVTFAPANSLFLVGSLSVQTRHPRSQVRNSLLVRLLGNPEGAIPQPPPDYNIPMPGQGQVVGEYLGPLEPYPVENLFSRAPNLAAPTEVDAGGIGGVDVDFAYLVSVLPRHRFAMTLDGLLQDVDLYLFRLDDSFQVVGDPVAVSATPGLAPESAEFDATAEKDGPVLLLLALDNVADVTGTTVSGALQQAQTESQSATVQTAMFSVPEFLSPCSTLSACTEDADCDGVACIDNVCLRACGPIDSQTECPPSYGEALACGAATGVSQFTLRGRNFLAGLNVHVGDSQAICSEVSSFDDFDQVTCLAPPTNIDPRQSTNVTIALTNPDGQAATLAEGFSYLPPPPSVFAVSPPAGPTTGGLTVTLRGNSFFGRDGSPPSVRFGAREATEVELGDGQLTAILPACLGLDDATPCGAKEVVDVTVLNPDGQSGSLFNGFTYLVPAGPAPIVTSVTPSQGPRRGGSTISIIGQNFDVGAFVRLGGATASGVVRVSSTELRAVTPAGAPGPTNIEVINEDLQTGRLAGAFTYLVPPPDALFVIPNSGPQSGDTSILINGSDFQIGAQVLIGDLAAQDVQVSATGASIVCTTPPGPVGPNDTVASVRVLNPDGQEDILAGAFRYEAPTGPPPAMSGLAPGQGSISGGDLVALSGSGFRTGAQVFFGQASAQSVAVLDGGTSINAVTPQHPEGIVDVSVRNPDGQTGGLVASFTYIVPSPDLVRVDPSQGTASGGTSVVMRGRDFQVGAQVSFGTNPGLDVVVLDHTQIVCTAPSGSAGSVDIVITNPDGRADSLVGGYTYAEVPAPSVALVDPAVGSENGGSQVRLVGSHFEAGAVVTFGGNVCGALQFVSATELQCMTPPGAGAVNIIVTNPDGRSGSKAGAFSYVAVPAPSVVLVDPATGLETGGEFIDIIGSDFQSAAIGRIGDRDCQTSIVLNAGTLRCLTPPSAPGTFSIAVQNPDGRSGSLAGAFSYLAVPAPTVFAAQPTQGSEAGGTLVTVLGADFGAGARVRFGSIDAVTVQFVSPTELLAVTPAHAPAAVAVHVINSDLQSGSLVGAYTFTAIQPPSITLVDPSDGPVSGGNIVQILGANFEDGATVLFGSTPALAVTVVSGTSISCRAPAGAGTVGITVTNPTTRTDTLVGAYEYLAVPPPSISSVSPSSGLDVGGDAIIITGSGFSAGATVSIAGATALNVVVVSGTQITCQTPAGTVGTASVMVTNPDAQSSTDPTGFAYVSPPAPVISAVLPTSGAQGGNTPVQVFGSGFRPGASVTLGGSAATSVQVLSPTAIACRTPAGSAGVVDVVVSNVDALSDTLASAFTYVDQSQLDPPPIVSALSPSSGPEAGGNQIEIFGSGFHDSARVFFVDVEAVVWSFEASRLVVGVPVGLGGEQVVVRVENPDGQSGFGSYTYTTAPAPLTVALVLPREDVAFVQTDVAILGQGFVSGATVEVEVLDALGDWRASATGVVVLNAETISARLPAYNGFRIDFSIGADLIVTNPGGETRRFINGFTYAEATECLPADLSACGHETAMSCPGPDCGDATTCACSGPTCVCQNLCAGQPNGTACGCAGTCRDGFCTQIAASCGYDEMCGDDGDADPMLGACVDFCGGCQPTEICSHGESGPECLEACNSDGTRQYPEQCDGSDFGGLTCLHVGFSAGALGCNNDCSLDTSHCIAPASCGDGVRDEWEDCDGFDLGPSADCSDLGFDPAQIEACLSNCRFDLTPCLSRPFEPVPGCGNGRLDLISSETPEQCDGSDLGAWSDCGSLGLGSGTPTCTVDCRLDLSACSSGALCGDARLDERFDHGSGSVSVPSVYYEECDGAVSLVLGCRELGFVGGSMGCTSTTCQWDTSSCISGAASCFDGVLNNDETGTDCGGSCPPCAEGTDCAIAADCLSGVCDTGNLCAPPTCSDGVQNGVESSTDCGRDCSTPCGVGIACNQDEDCDRASNLFCSGAICSVASCGDGIVGGIEQCEGGDYGGLNCEILGYPDGGTLACASCLIDQSGCSLSTARECSFDSDCTASMVCRSGTCIDACDCEGCPACVPDGIVCPDGFFSCGDRCAARPEQCSMCDMGMFICADDSCYSDPMACQGGCPGGFWDCRDGSGSCAAIISMCGSTACGGLICGDGTCATDPSECEGTMPAGCPPGFAECGDGACAHNPADCGGACTGAGNFACSDASCVTRWEDCCSFVCQDWTECVSKTSPLCDGVPDCLDGSDESWVQCQVTCLDIPGAFSCPGGLCVMHDQLCDGIEHCPDAADEMMLDCALPCGFVCEDSSCVTQEQVCDGMDDCAGAEDEDPVLCGCAPGFDCGAGGGCVPGPWVCDGVSDCPDGSDEGSPACGAGCPSPFVCPDGTCLPAAAVCDTTVDCASGFDESATLCGSAFVCTSGDRVAVWRTCDGVVDCTDASDEAAVICGGCGPLEFGCGDGRCISSKRLCDGRPDCGAPGTEDEDSINCCQPSEFRCFDGQCASDAICDAINDCPDGSDEDPILCAAMMSGGDPGCPGFRCASGECINSMVFEDGNCDCPDGSDEPAMSCPGTQGCSPERFDCGDGGCTDAAFVCDGLAQCANGRDEQAQICGDYSCPAGRFNCPGAGCIPIAWMCNSTPECPGSEDEGGAVCSGGEGPICGDGQLDSGESCDDGAGNSDVQPDACRSDCSMPHCSDGVVDPGFGEQCDMGPGNSDTTPDACRMGCSLPYCGDGVTDADERCDDGNAAPADGCEPNCTPTASTCNSGSFDGDETDLDCGGSCLPCADGLSCGIGADCLSANCFASTCEVPNCGDGLVNGDETGLDCGGAICPQCPDGAGCTFPGDCQSGICINGLCATGGTGCGTGQFDCGDTSCIPESWVCDAAFGQCPGDTDEAQCNMSDGMTCQVGPQCMSGLCNAGMCAVGGGICGDGMLDDGEICDDGTSNGFGEGFCTTDCTATQWCGSGMVEGSEVCDGVQLMGADCVTVGGFTGGVLACDSGCQTFDTSGCTP